MALFSLFFGAGNLILPPLLGLHAGTAWPWVLLGFALSAVLIPILGIQAHARLQGTMFDFGKKVSKPFALGYCFLVYAISISLPAPRTASVTHEIAVGPLTGISSWFTAIIYFILVYLFVINRTKILSLIGKWLTPIIVLILLAIFGVSVIDFGPLTQATSMTAPFFDGVLEGYHTFDAIGSVVVGGVIIVSLQLDGTTDRSTNKRIIGRAGWIAGTGLFLVYAGLLLSGALMEGQFSADISRAELLNGLASNTLGKSAQLLLSLLVSLACFTTAVGIVTGTADFFKWYFNDSQMAFRITALIGCILGVLMGQFNVAYIIAVAMPALMLIYPVTIVLILLNLLPESWSTPKLFRWVVVTTIVFSIPDFLISLGLLEQNLLWLKWLPLSEHGMGWVVPASLSLVLARVSIKHKA